MNMAMFIPGMSGLPEILLILFVILLLFGSKRLPDLARSLGRSLGEFKKGREEGDKKISVAQTEETSEEDNSTPKQS